MHEAAENDNGKVEAVKNPETLYLSRTKHPFAIKCKKVSRERKMKENHLSQQEGEFVLFCMHVGRKE
jgi:hypothetical protein